MEKFNAKTLNPEATRTAQKLYEAMFKGKHMTESGHARIDTRPGTYVAVVVERLHRISGYIHFSITQYDNGETMHMVFITQNGKFYAVAFQNDNGNRDQDVFCYSGDGEPLSMDNDLQIQLTEFANNWLRDIQLQQDI